MVNGNIEVDFLAAKQLVATGAERARAEQTEAAEVQLGRAIVDFNVPLTTLSPWMRRWLYYNSGKCVQLLR